MPDSLDQGFIVDKVVLPVARGVQQLVDVFISEHQTSWLLLSFPFLVTAGASTTFIFIRRIAIG